MYVSPVCCFSMLMMLIIIIQSSASESGQRRVTNVSIGVFIEPQSLLSAGGALTTGVRGHGPPEIFENLGSQKSHFLHFETHFRQITTLFYSSFLSYVHHFDGIIVSI